MKVSLRKWGLVVVTLCVISCFVRFDFFFPRIRLFGTKDTLLTQAVRYDEKGEELERLVYFVEEQRWFYPLSPEGAQAAWLDVKHRFYLLKVDGSKHSLPFMLTSDGTQKYGLYFPLNDGESWVAVALPRYSEEIADAKIVKFNTGGEIQTFTVKNCVVRDMIDAGHSLILKEEEGSTVLTFLTTEGERFFSLVSGGFIGRSREADEAK